MRKITLAAILALGAAPLNAVGAAPAAAHDVRTAKLFVSGGFDGKFYHHRHYWRSHRFHRRAPRARFLARVRRGDLICFDAGYPRRWHRFHRHGHDYRFYHKQSRRLGWRAVRRLIRHGRGHAIRCFARY